MIQSKRSHFNGGSVTQSHDPVTISSGRSDPIPRESLEVAQPEHLDNRQASIMKKKKKKECCHPLQGQTTDSQATSLPSIIL